MQLLSGAEVYQQFFPDFNKVTQKDVCPRNVHCPVTTVSYSMNTSSSTVLVTDSYSKTNGLSPTHGIVAAVVTLTVNTVFTLKQAGIIQY